LDTTKIEILKMLEENKITSAEAVSLLQALENENSGGTGTTENPRTDSTGRVYGNQRPTANMPDDDIISGEFHFDDSQTQSGTQQSNYQSNSHQSNNQYNGNGANNSNGGGFNYDPNAFGAGNNSANSENTFEQNFDNFARDISEKFAAFSKKLEPKVKEIKTTVAQKADEMAKNYRESHAQPRTPKNPRTPQATGQKFTALNKVKNIDIKISGTSNQLNVGSLNGNLTIRGYNGDNVTGKVFYKPKTNNPDIDFIKLGDKYLLSYKNEEFESVSVDLFVPEKLFTNFLIEGNRGNVNVSTINAEIFVVSNKNGNTIVSNITTDTLKVDCNNSDLKINNIVCSDGLIENNNGNISASNINIEKMKIEGFNCGVDITMEDFINHKEYLWEIESSNAKAVFNMPLLKNVGYYLNGRTTLNNIAVSLLGLEYISKSDCFVEARTMGYDNMQKHVLLRVETSNAPIQIN